MRKHTDSCHYCGDLGSISCGAEVVRVPGHAIIMCGGVAATQEGQERWSVAE